MSAIGPVCQVSCGSAHTLALSQDSTTALWSFGAGSSGCLGHGGTDKQLKPKVRTTIPTGQSVSHSVDH